MLLLLDANGALILAAVGLLAICAEFCLPGWVWPGVTGGVFLVCGLYRLVTLEAHAGPGAGLLALLALASVAGYGWAPPWLGVAAVCAAPWLCRGLLPGVIAWPAAAVAALPVASVFGLLRIASRAAGNKTLLQ